MTEHSPTPNRVTTNFSKVVTMDPEAAREKLKSLSEATTRLFDRTATPDDFIAVINATEGLQSNA